jgi:ABC-2 type transport system ATP-binding protein
VEPGLIALPDGVEVADLVARLVHGGVRINAVEPQRRNLEQIYLSITQPSSAGNSSSSSSS